MGRNGIGEGQTVPPLYPLAYGRQAYLNCRSGLETIRAETARHLPELAHRTASAELGGLRRPTLGIPRHLDKTSRRFGIVTLDDLLAVLVDEMLDPAKTVSEAFFRGVASPLAACRSEL